MKKKTYTRPQVEAILKRQIRHVADAAARMAHSGRDFEIAQNLREIKPIKF